MKIVRGSKIQEISAPELHKLVSGAKKVVGDLGTGDGRFVYKNAMEDTEEFYIGIEPNQKQLAIYSKEANKKRLNNVIFVVGSIENLPKELEGVFDELNILLPWGSLLQQVVTPNHDSLESLYKILKPTANINIIFGYDEKYDPGEVQRLGLDKVDKNYLENTWKTLWKEHKFLIEKISQLSAKDVRELETSWAKKLSYGNLRPWYKVEIKKG